MKMSFNMTAVGLCAVMFASPVLADDVTGANRIICSAVQTTECLVGQECVSGPPLNWNIPHFMVIDFDAKTMKTTEASQLQRTTEIDTMHRNEEGEIIVQGIQGNRAFSAVISEGTGVLSVAIALEGQVISVFGACTPLESSD